MISTPWKVLIALALAAALPVAGQFTSTTSSGAKTRAEPYLDDKGAPLDQPDKPLRIVKLKGVIEKVDLKPFGGAVLAAEPCWRSVRATQA